MATCALTSVSGANAYVFGRHARIKSDSWHTEMENSIQLVHLIGSPVYIAKWSKSHFCNHHRNTKQTLPASTLKIINLQ